MPSKPVICGFARSPFTPANKGGLATVRPDDIAATVIKGLLDKVALDPALVEDVLVGCAFPEGEQGFNLGRMVGFLAGLPVSVGGVTINRFCGSSMQAIHDAAGRIALGAGDAFIAGGVESMSRIPMSGFNPLPNPRLAAEQPEAFTNMGVTAENLALAYEISRTEQEEFAVASHQRAVIASQAGVFSEVIIPIETEDGIVSEDGCIRAQSDVATLAKLRPAFIENGSVTAGTSSPLTDGAAFVLVCSEEFAQQHGLTPMARILGIIGLAGSVPGLIFVHLVYGIGFSTLYFRNYYAQFPSELVRAAMIDGAGFFTIFRRILLPSSGPIAVVCIIWQFTNIWNDFLFGVSFASGDSAPITVALNNLVNSSTGVKAYNVNMAAAMVAAVPTLIVYILAGKYFLRGLMSGSVKG